MPDVAGDGDSIPESERSPGEGNGNPLQYSFLENPMDRGAWWSTVHGVAKESDTTEQLNSNSGASGHVDTCIYIYVYICMYICVYSWLLNNVEVRGTSPPCSNHPPHIIYNQPFTSQFLHTCEFNQSQITKYLAFNSVKNSYMSGPMQFCVVQWSMVYVYM